MKKARILVVEDNESYAELLFCQLTQAGYEVVVCNKMMDAMTQATSLEIETVVSDYELPDGDGLQLLDKIHSNRPQLPIIIMTGYGTTDMAIEATKHGAFDYLPKPVRVDDLLAAIDKALECHRFATQRVAFSDVKQIPQGEAMVGQSRAMQMIYKEIGRVASRPVPVLILGATGSGKELVARAVYSHSDRCEKPFIAVNCAAIPETLLESELFGHEKGAFTGAHTRRIGRFEQAHKGTLFLDEIGDLSASTQAKLLRVLQEKQIQRLGGSETIPIDVRVIAATHQNLEKMIRSGQFREDLYFRLNVVLIRLPSLAERREDIPMLVEYFLRRHEKDLMMPGVSMDSEAVEVFQMHSWPGNVRELENCVRKAMIHSGGYRVTSIMSREILGDPDVINADTQGASAEWMQDLLMKAMKGQAAGIYDQVIHRVEADLFRQAYQMAGGNQMRVANWMGISRTTLREKLERYGIYKAKLSNGA